METCPAKDFIVTDPPYGVRVSDPGFSEKISDSRKCRALNGKRNETCLQLADVS